MSAETALAHPCLISEDRKRNFLGQMPIDPVVKRTKFILRRLQRQSSAKLRLPARTLKEDNHVASDSERHGTAEVLLDQRQREIDAGRHTRRGPNLAIAHKDRI